MIKSTTKTHTLTWLERINKGKKLDFTIAIQRKEVWDLEHKGNLIISALMGIPIESLLFEEDENENDEYLVLDGKQRGTTFIQYLRGDFAISENCKIKVVMGIDIVGKYFKDLPEDMQDSLKDCEISIAVLRPLTEEERETIFFMRNQAVPLAKAELTRVILGSTAMNIVEDFCKHPFLEKTNISRRRYLDQQVMLECLLLESGKDYGFSGKDTPKFAQEVKEEGISDETRNSILSVLDYLDVAIVEKNRSLRKVHIPMVYALAKEAMKDNFKPGDFAIWVNRFFKDIKGDSNEYTKACDNGSALKTNVQKRLKFMKEHYETYIFNQLNIVKNVEVKVAVTKEGGVA